MIIFTPRVASGFLWTFGLTAAPIAAAAFSLWPDLGPLAVVLAGLVVIFECQLVLALIEAGRQPDLFPASLFSACFEFVLLLLLALTWLGEIRA